MPDQTSNGMQCHEFETLVSDALDGVLTGAQLNAFQAHTRTCSACGPLLADVTAGRNWLKDLTEVEPPVSLVTNILASTTGVDTQRLRVNVSAAPRVPRLGASWWERTQAWASGAFQPILGYRPAAAVRHVIRHGVLLAVGRLERTRRKTRRPALRSACVPQPFGTPTTTRKPALSATTKTSGSFTRSNRACANSSVTSRPPSPAQRIRAGQERPQERHNRTARAEAGAQLQPDRESTYSGQRSSGSICKRSVYQRSVCSVGDHVQEVRMNCATHNDIAAVGFLPHLREAALRQLHPRRPRSHLLRALPRSPSWKALPRQPHSCLLQAAYPALATARCRPPAFIRLRPQSRRRRHPRRILSLRRRCRLLLAIRQGTGSPAHLRHAHLRLRSCRKLGLALRHRHRFLLRLPDHRCRPHRPRSSGGPARARSLRPRPNLQRG